MLRVLNFFVLLLIRIYKFCVSPLLGQNCRFTPSCSQYCFDCFNKFSFLQALWYSMRRLSRCHPWHPGGHDPAP